MSDNATRVRGWWEEYALDEHEPAVAGLTALLDAVQAEALDEALALFNAPTSENNGGPGDLLEEIKALQHNAKVWAQEAAEAEKRGAERERGRFHLFSLRKRAESLGAKALRVDRCHRCRWREAFEGLRDSIRARGSEQ